MFKSDALRRLIINWNSLGTASGTRVCHSGIRNSYVFTQLLLLASLESLDLLEFGDGLGGVAKILQKFKPNEISLQNSIWSYFKKSAIWIVFNSISIIQLLILNLNHFKWKEEVASVWKERHEGQTATLWVSATGNRQPQRCVQWKFRPEVVLNEKGSDAWMNFFRPLRTQLMLFLSILMNTETRFYFLAFVFCYCPAGLYCKKKKNNENGCKQPGGDLLLSGPTANANSMLIELTAIHSIVIEINSFHSNCNKQKLFTI